jgi:hypothetical protein
MMEQMTPRPGQPHTSTSGAIRLRSRWPSWVGYAAAVWSLLYGLLGVAWTLGGPGFPFGADFDEAAADTSLLEHAQPATTGPVIALLGLCAALAAALIVRPRPRVGLGATMLTAFAWSLALGLAVVVPDYRPLLAVVRLPLLLGGAPFGWPEQVSLGEFLSTFLPWPVLNQILLIAGGLLWAATAVSFRRRVRGACENCGRSDGVAPGWAAPASCRRWGRSAIYVAVVVPVGYALTRWAWALDIPLGTSREGLHKEAAENPGIWLAGALMATMAVGGAILTFGLDRKWGEIYPRWIPFLAGKPVRPRTAIVPALLVAILVTSAGLMYARHLIIGRVELDRHTWGETVPQLFWPLWGFALGAATLAYHLRRRGRCPHCAPPSRTAPVRSDMIATTRAA